MINQEISEPELDLGIEPNSSQPGNLPAVIMGENNTELLLYEKDFGLDPNVLHAALFNWTEHIVYEKHVKFRNRTVNIVGPTKSKEQLKTELEKLKNSNPNIKTIKDLAPQLPICGDIEARMYFAILKIFYQQQTINNGVMPRQIYTTYQEIKNLMGLSPTFPTPDLKDSLFRLAHTRYDFKDSYTVAAVGGDNIAAKISHSLYLLKYIEFEVEKLKHSIDQGEEVEDYGPISEYLKSLLNKRGKPTATLLRISLDEGQWNNLSRGYYLLFSYEHLKMIPTSVARGLYLFLDPNQGLLFNTGKIVPTNTPNIFMVKAQYIIEYLGSSEINPTRSLKRVNKALDLLKVQGFIKDYEFAKGTRRVLDGVYSIEFFPEQSRSKDNKYGSFMVKGNPNALRVPMTEKKEIDYDYENIMEDFYKVVNGEKLLISYNKITLKSIYYDESNIKPAKFLSLPLDKTYGYYYLRGILYGLTKVRRSKDLNALIRGIILAESNPSSNKSGYKNHANTLMQRDFIKKYGQEQFDELTEQVMHSLHSSLNEDFIPREEIKPEDFWPGFVEFYKEVIPNCKHSDKLNQFSYNSRSKIINEYQKNKFLAVKLVNYVLNEAKDINKYLFKHGVDDKFYVDEVDAEVLKNEYETRVRDKSNKQIEKETNKVKKQATKLRQEQVENEFNLLDAETKSFYENKARVIIDKHKQKLESIYSDIEKRITLCVYAVLNNDSYDKSIELYLKHQLNIDILVL